jgi:hypothetical protein
MGSTSLLGPFQQPKHSRKLINGNKTDADGADQNPQHGNKSLP